MPEPRLTARKLVQYLPACESGQHVTHPLETCEDYEAYCASARRWWQQVGRGIPHTPISEVPPALRGPNWPGP